MKLFASGVLNVFFDNLDDVLAIKERYRDPATAEPSAQLDTNSRM
jgi:hypothetical protein